MAVLLMFLSQSPSELVLVIPSLSFVEETFHSTTHLRLSLPALNGRDETEPSRVARSSHNNKPQETLFIPHDGWCAGEKSRNHLKLKKRNREISHSNRVQREASCHESFLLGHRLKVFFLIFRSTPIERLKPREERKPSHGSSLTITSRVRN
jgi:hypothetical protein